MAALSSALGTPILFRSDQFTAPSRSQMNEDNHHCVMTWPRGRQRSVEDLIWEAGMAIHCSRNGEVRNRPGVKARQPGASKNGGLEMLVKEVMEKPVTIGPDETLKTAAMELKDCNTGCLLVCEGAHVIGILTDRDVLLRGPASMRDLNETNVREVMSAELQCCHEDDPLERAAELMSNNHVHRLPVLNSDQELVGVVSLNRVDHGASQRAPVEVIFYKEITDSYGRPHHGEQRRIIVGPGHSRDQAVAAAKKRFEEEFGGAWKTFADGYDVVEVRSEPHGRATEELTATAEK